MRLQRAHAAFQQHCPRHMLAARRAVALQTRTSSVMCSPWHPRRDLRGLSTTPHALTAQEARQAAEEFTQLYEYERFLLLVGWCARRVRSRARVRGAARSLTSPPRHSQCGGLAGAACLPALRWRRTRSPRPHARSCTHRRAPIALDQTAWTSACGMPAPEYVGEYTFARLKDFLASKGIAHQLSALCTPQQNGTAERLNQTLAERVGAMIKEYDTPRHLWAEAFTTANLIRNRSPAANPARLHRLRDLLRHAA